MPRFVALFIVAAAFGLPFWWFERGTPSPSIENEINGEVRDDTGPVAGAIVRIKGAAAATVSDAHGRFRIAGNVPAGASRVTAAKNGYFIAGASIRSNPLIVRLSRLPSQDCERYEWVDPTPNPRQPTNCGNCHQAIHQEWESTGHARSANNRRFLDLYDDLLKEHPLGADVCSSCHAPTQNSGPFGAFDMREASKLQHGLSGVHCDYCHKIQGPGAGEFGLTHGRYQLSLLRPLSTTDHEKRTTDTQQLFFGPLDDVDRGDDAHSPFQRDSRLCAACHEGVIFGVPVYSTYSEWRDSPARRAGSSCQSCHMAPTRTMTNIAPGHGGIRRDPAALGNHRFFDGSQLDMLRRCLKMEASSSRGLDRLDLNVSLATTNVGHRVPTGFIDRQVILFVDAYIGKRAVAAYHGPVLPETIGPDEAGRSGRLYAKVLTDGKTATPAPFWKADPSTLRDTRLRPGEVDRLTFQFPADVDRVRIQVVHRRFWKSTAQQKGWPVEDQVIVDEEVRLP